MSALIIQLKCRAAYATRSKALPKFVANELKQTLRSSAFKLKPSIVPEFTKLYTKFGNQFMCVCP
jgi:hypothetical protein